jgi:lipopolysaccharide transport system ATP-binding protein
MMCNRVIYLRQGQIAYDGPTEEGLSLYESESKLATAPFFRTPPDPSLVITDIDLLGENGERKTMFDFGERMRVRVGYRALKSVEGPNFLISIKRSDGVLCCNFSSYTDEADLPWIAGDGVIELLTPPLKLVSDHYTVIVSARERGFHQLIAGQIGVSFHLRHEIFDANEFGVFHERGQWQVEATSAGYKELSHERR